MSDRRVRKEKWKTIDQRMNSKADKIKYTNIDNANGNDNELNELMNF